LAGANINDVTPQKATALHLAAAHDRASICAALLGEHIHCNAVDEALNNGNDIHCSVYTTFSAFLHCGLNRLSSIPTYGYCGLRDHPVCTRGVQTQFTITCSINVHLTLLCHVSLISAVEALHDVLLDICKFHLNCLSFSYVGIFVVNGTVFHILLIFLFGFFFVV